MSNTYIDFLNDLFLALEDTLDEVQRTKKDTLEEHKLLSQLEIVGNIIKEFEKLQKPRVGINE